MNKEMKMALLKSTMSYGAILGASVSAVTLLMYVLGQMFSSSTAIIRFIVIVSILIYSQRSIRDKLFNEQITYKTALGMGIYITAFAGIIVSFFTFVLYNYIDPKLLEETFINTEETLLQLGIFSEDKIEYIMENTRENYTPLSTFFSGIFEFAFKGLIISLITSIFVKRSDDTFDNAMKKVD